jgi:hypothetical protein
MRATTDKQHRPNKNIIRIHSKYSEQTDRTATYSALMVLEERKHMYDVCTAYLHCLFMFVLAVARNDNPRVKCDAISSFDFTSASVTPARVMPPTAVSRI